MSNIRVVDDNEDSSDPHEEERAEEQESQCVRAERQRDKMSKH